MKLKAKGYTVLFMLTYMVSYITRINYGAVILAMEEATGLSNAALSMALTGSFITYGAGQLVSGWAGDRISPKKLIFFGLLLTTAMNLLIPVSSSHGQMLVIWCINGFAQSFMWPPLVRLMTVLLSEEEYKKATVRVSWGSCLGTVIIYVFAPYILTLAGWKSVFLFSAACGAVMAGLWFFLCPEISIRQKRVVEEKQRENRLLSPMMFGIMTAVVLMGALRDGVTTWMPTYISETYNLGSAVSILTGAVLPLFSILCFQAASALHRKKLRNPIFCAGFIFAIGTASAFCLFFFTGHSAAFSVAFSALLTGSMHGVNLMLISMLPAYFTPNISTASGLLNSCTYIGSALSTYGIALVAERAGWNMTLLLWTALAAAGTILCLVCTRPWQKRFMGK